MLGALMVVKVEGLCHLCALNLAYINGKGGSFNQIMEGRGRDGWGGLPLYSCVFINRNIDSKSSQCAKTSRSSTSFEACLLPEGIFRFVAQLTAMFRM